VRSGVPMGAAAFGARGRAQVTACGRSVRSRFHGSAGDTVGRVAEGRLYWRGAVEHEAIQDAHGFVWTAMLDTIDVDLAGKRVLAVGCNQGGLLCLLSDACEIADGCGYDPASRRLTMPVVSLGRDRCTSRSPTPCLVVGQFSTLRSATRCCT
jgi:hypothetical protein